ncbi:[NiFe]-hydrogenase assembly chaperone HybE [Inmirania thermothiophila]|uniref:[NiFe] hydrogenase assembly HybE family chaperone n=1 Tax=Inmirania thermothiophila TaxID=1750597 RepID=A0A3N1Y131_9GAMM|nr:[NiFe]-hydrogenase assembly chaperone HybE [Inmirania thermothiophila]ROR32535.1 [NiFe] hydrogenase assembly HybE family chaperone [Inmirania thermothiophila]
MEPSAGSVGGPGPLLERVFERIHRESMQGLPLVNPALRVRAVGFRRLADAGRWVGVLVTPWFMNLMVLSDGTRPLPEAATGERVTLRFPSGAYRFTAGEVEEVGRYLFCSLASPVHCFPDAETAERTAAEVMELLLRAPEGAQEAPAPDPGRRGLLGLGRCARRAEAGA